MMPVTIFEGYIKKKPETDVSGFLEHETGFEPATLALARRYSTTEPLVHILDVNRRMLLYRDTFTMSRDN